VGAIGGIIIVVAVIAVFTMVNLSGAFSGRRSGRGFDPLDTIDPQTGEPIKHQPGTGHHGGHHGGGSAGGGHHGGGHFGGFSGGGDAGGGGHHGH
jgi:hypothetical protein